MRDFFISYNKADRDWAEWIAWELEDAGYSVVIQAWDFRPGSNFVLEMNEALKGAERMVAVLSPDYISSRFTAPEWAAVFARDSSGADSKLIPVRVKSADLSGLLGQIVYIDFVGATEEAITRKLLLDGVKGGRDKPKQKPAFPGSSTRSQKDRPRYPGVRTTVWNVPHSRNRNFTGRSELLSDLRSRLQRGHHLALTALHGLGGIGKTQTAVEYIHRFAGEYDIVWWIRSDDPATLAGDYALLAAKLQLSEAEADQHTAVEAVKALLATTPGWILIFDNARSPEEVHPYLPVGSSGHIIITSRSPDWRSLADPLSVDTWGPEDAVAFLHRRSGQRDECASLELVKELGYLPLAVEQAAAYIDVTHKPISDYLELFRKCRQQLLRRGQPVDYPDTVETAWKLCFDEVAARSPAGATLLDLCAFFAPEGIPIEVIRAGSDRLPEPLAGAAGDELGLDDAISSLRRYSLMERSYDVLSIHRLVQAVVRDRMTAAERRRWVETAAGVIRKAFPYDSDDVRTWPTCARLLPHATAVSAHCEAEQAGFQFASGLLSQSALYLQARAEFSAALALNKRALKIYEALHGPEHPNVVTSINNLANVLKDLGHFEDARKHFERALEIREAAYGPDHPSISVCLNNLGSVLHHLGQPEEARKHFERSLMLDERSLGPNHAEVAIRINNLGTVLRELGELRDARKHCERALKIFEASFGPDHPSVGICVNNLGLVLNDLGELDEARKHFERALRIDEVAMGPDHPQVATTLNNLASSYELSGELDQARKHFQRALEICENSLGSDHPSTQTVRDNLRMLPV